MKEQLYLWRIGMLILLFVPMACGDDEEGVDLPDGGEVDLPDGGEPDAGCTGSACITYCQEHSCWKVPPTNQLLCYSDTVSIECSSCGGANPPVCGDSSPIAFCGQDAQYPDSARTYTCKDSAGTDKNCSLAPADGDVVEDSVYGLMWQRVLPANFGTDCDDAETCTWEQAKNYCTNLSYGSHADWRLPDYYELSSIVDYGRYEAAIDPVAFAGAPAFGAWTSSPSAGLPDSAWNVGFYDGPVRHAPKINTARARCVRGVPLQFNEPERFDVSGSTGQEIVVDRATGLGWQKTFDAYLMLWTPALSHCEALSYGGHQDWRLPNINELQSLVNVEKDNSASDFPDMPSDIFWSSSTWVMDAIWAWYLDFNDGNVAADEKDTDFHYVRCVRDAL